MANVKSKEAIVASVQKNCGHFAKGQVGFHNDLLSLARHICETGDHTVALTVINIVQDDDHAHREATHMVRWLDKYAGVTFTETEDDEGNVVVKTNWRGAKFIKDNFKSGKDNPYYKGIKKTNPFRFNLVEYLEAGVTKSNSAMQKKAKDATAEVDVTGLDNVKELVATLKAS